MQFEILGTDPIRDAVIIKMPYRWLKALCAVDVALSGQTPEQMRSALNDEVSLEKVFIFLENLAHELNNTTDGVTLTIHTARNITIGKRAE